MASGASETETTDTHRDVTNEFENQREIYKEKKNLHYCTISRGTKNETRSGTIFTTRSSTNKLGGRNTVLERSSLLPLRDNGENNLFAFSMLLCTLPVLQRGGIPLHVHYLWPAFLLLSFLIAIQISYLHAICTIVLLGPILLLTIVIHELGHAAMAIFLGGKVKAILLWPLGGLAYFGVFSVDDPFRDALIAIAGPLTHIPQVGAWVGIMAISNHGVVTLHSKLNWGYDFWLSVCSSAIAIQVAVFCFNCIPAQPLDGGRVFGAFLNWKKFNQKDSFYISAIVGWTMGSIILITSMAMIITNTSSLYLGWNSIFLSLFILYYCFNLWMYGNQGSERELSNLDFTTEIVETDRRRSEPK